MTCNLGAVGGERRPQSTREQHTSLAISFQNSPHRQEVPSWGDGGGQSVGLSLGAPRLRSQGPPLPARGGACCSSAQQRDPRACPWEVRLWREMGAHVWDGTYGRWGRDRVFPSRPQAFPATVSALRHVVEGCVALGTETWGALAVGTPGWGAPRRGSLEAATYCRQHTAEPGVPRHLVPTGRGRPSSRPRRGREGGLCGGWAGGEPVPRTPPHGQHGEHLRHLVARRVAWGHCPCSLGGLLRACPSSRASARRVTPGATSGQRVPRRESRADRSCPRRRCSA